MAIVLVFVFWDNALTLYILMNYLIILAILIATSEYAIKIAGVPTWLGQCSFDIYLTHKIVLMAFTTFIPSVSLLLFSAGTAIIATIFYRIRKVIKI